MFIYGSLHLAEAVRSVCVGEAQAFFEDHITVFSLLLSNPPCPGTPLRMLPMPTIKIQLGIGATRESAAAADAIREEISAMASDGSLERIVGVWSHAGSQELASLIMLQQAKSHLRWYRIGFVSVAALFAVRRVVGGRVPAAENEGPSILSGLRPAQNGMCGWLPTV